MRPALHYAITAHGLGHFTRSVLILKALCELCPDLDVHVSTAVNAPWIQRQLQERIQWRVFEYEPGAVQTNPFEVDEPATIAAYHAFLADHAEQLAQEVDFLRAHRFVGVVSDCPALAVRGAAEVGIPAIGVSNFTWDWILEPWLDAQPTGTSILGLLRRDYASGWRHLILPFGQKQSPFPDYEASLLVGRRATLPREVVRSRLGVTGRVALVSPGGWDGEGWPEIVARAGDATLITVGNLPIRSDSPVVRLSNNLAGALTFPDLVNAADVVVGKPGYGLASECLLHRVPFVMIERPRFRETAVLQAEFEEMGSCAVLSLESFFDGSWKDAIEAVLDDGRSWIALPRNPERRIAARILELLGLDH